MTNEQQHTSIEPWAGVEEQAERTMSYIVEDPCLGEAAVCEPILRSLPDWFGIEEAIVHYTAEIDHLPTFLARESDRVLGFLSLKQHNPFSAEVYVMAVRQEAHRRGIGRALLDHAQEWLKGQGYEFLQVKTLGPSHCDQNYARTRAFYLAAGFRPLEEFGQLWDDRNPCLIMVKRL
jgi:GNAT superfamily N-acetyltransferase